MGKAYAKMDVKAMGSARRHSAGRVSMVILCMGSWGFEPRTVSCITGNASSLPDCDCVIAISTELREISIYA
jgi:hypothetical protein